jgi:hypothetical protein
MSLPETNPRLNDEMDPIFFASRTHLAKETAYIEKIHGLFW